MSQLQEALEELIKKRQTIKERLTALVEERDLAQAQVTQPLEGVSFDTIATVQDSVSK